MAECRNSVLLQAKAVSLTVTKGNIDDIAKNMMRIGFSGYRTFIKGRADVRTNPQRTFGAAFGADIARSGGLSPLACISIVTLPRILLMNFKALFCDAER